MFRFLRRAYYLAMSGIRTAWHSRNDEYVFCLVTWHPLQEMDLSPSALRGFYEQIDKAFEQLGVGKKS